MRLSHSAAPLPLSKPSKTACAAIQLVPQVPVEKDERGLDALMP